MCSSLFMEKDFQSESNLDRIYLFDDTSSSINISRSDIYPDILRRSSKRKKLLKWSILRRRFALRDMEDRCKAFISFYPAKISEGRAYALSSYASCFKPSYSYPKDTCLHWFRFPFLLFPKEKGRERERVQDLSVIRVPNHAQMSFVDVLLRARVYLVA